MSGLSLAAYCRQVGVCPKRIRWWRDRLKDWNVKRPEQDGPRLVPVLPTAPPKPRLAGGAVRLLLPGGVALELDPAHVSATWVAAIVSEVARRP
jgi:hypothetical protein